jgi:hypothetical protein
MAAADSCGPGSGPAWGLTVYPRLDLPILSLMTPYGSLCARRLRPGIPVSRPALPVGVGLVERHRCDDPLDLLPEICPCVLMCVTFDE